MITSNSTSNYAEQLLQSKEPYFNNKILQKNVAKSFHQTHIAQSPQLNEANPQQNNFYVTSINPFVSPSQNSNHKGLHNSASCSQYAQLDFTNTWNKMKLNPNFSKNELHKMFLQKVCRSSPQNQRYGSDLQQQQIQQYQQKIQQVQSVRKLIKASQSNSMVNPTSTMPQTPQMQARQAAETFKTKIQQLENTIIPTAKFPHINSIKATQLYTKRDAYSQYQIFNDISKSFEINDFNIRSSGDAQNITPCHSSSINNNKNKATIPISQLMDKLEIAFNDNMQELDNQFSSHIFNDKLILRIDFINRYLKCITTFHSNLIQSLAECNLHAFAVCIDMVDRINVKIFDKIFLQQKEIIEAEVIDRVQQYQEDYNNLKIENTSLLKQISLIREETKESLYNLSRNLDIKDHKIYELTDENEKLKLKIDHLTDYERNNQNLKLLESDSKTLGKQVRKLQEEQTNTVIQSYQGLQNLVKITQQTFQQAESNFSIIQSSAQQMKQIKVSSKFDDALNLGKKLLQHPFQFYYIFNLDKFSYNSFLQKGTSFNYLATLEQFLIEKADQYIQLEKNIQLQQSSEQEKANLGATSDEFLDFLLRKHKETFAVSVKLTELLQFFKVKYDEKKLIGKIFASIFGLFQENVADKKIMYIASRMWKELFSQNKLMKAELYEQILENNIYVDIQLATDTINRILENDVKMQKTIMEHLTKFIIFQKKCQREKSIHQAKQLKQVKQEFALTLIPSIMQKLGTLDLNQAIESLTILFKQLDLNNSGFVNINEFSDLLQKQYFIDLAIQANKDVYDEFMINEKQKFNYIGFLNKIVQLNLPDQINENKVQVLTIILEVINKIFDIQKQQELAQLRDMEIFMTDVYPYEYFQFIQLHQNSDKFNQQNNIIFNQSNLTTVISHNLFIQAILDENYFSQLYVLHKSNDEISINHNQKVYQRQNIIKNILRLHKFLVNYIPFMVTKNSRLLDLSESNQIQNQQGIKSQMRGSTLLSMTTKLHNKLDQVRKLKKQSLKMPIKFGKMPTLAPQSPLNSNSPSNSIKKSRRGGDTPSNKNQSTSPSPAIRASIFNQMSHFAEASKSIIEDN